MRRVIVSSATSPSSGMSAEKIDGDEVLLGGKKCVENYAKFLPKFISLLPKEIFTEKNESIIEKGI